MNSKDITDTTEYIYQNVMELLVKEEIEQQLKYYPKNIRLSLRTVEIEAYALNRLPALYASSEKGRDLQKQLGQQKYQKQISTAVHRGLAMVEQNPYHQSKALITVSEIERKYQQAQEALQKLQQFLKNTQLLKNISTEMTWDNLVSEVKEALINLYRKENEKAPQCQLQSQTTDKEIILGWDSDFIR